MLYTIPHYVQNSQEGNLYYPLKSKFPARVTQQVAFINISFRVYNTNYIQLRKIYRWKGISSMLLSDISSGIQISGTM